MDNGDQTRATDVTSLSGYQLWGTASDAEWWLGGKTVVNNAIEDQNWMSEETTTFYGICTSNAITLSDNVTIGLTDEKFNGTFTYLVPSTVASQEDLLAGVGTGNPTDGATIDFKHLLSAFTALNIKLDANQNGVNDAGKTYDLVIESITFHNLINAGSFTFSTEADEAPGSWDTSSFSAEDWVANTSKGDLTIPVNQTLSFAIPTGTPGVTAQAPTDAGYKAASVITKAISLSDVIYILPQSGITAWNPGTPVSKVYPNDPANAYVSIACKLYLHEGQRVVEAAYDSDNGEILGDVDGEYCCPDAATISYMEEEEMDPEDDYGELGYGFPPSKKGNLITIGGAFVGGGDDDTAETTTNGEIVIPFKAASLAVNKGYTLTLKLVESLKNTSTGVKPTYNTASFTN